MAEEKTFTKSITSYHRFSSDEFKVIKFAASISKNIFNTTIFCYSIFLKYSSKIYKDLLNIIHIRFKLFNDLKNELYETHPKFKENIDLKDLKNKVQIREEVIETILYDIYEQYYLQHCEIKDLIHINNQIIYQFIIDKLKTENLTVVNNNYFQIRDDIILDLTNSKLIENIEVPELFIEIIDNILKSIYNRNFMTTKDEILNKKRVKINDPIFIEQVKNNKYIIPIVRYNIKEALEKYLSDNVNVITHKRMVKPHKNSKKPKNPPKKKTSFTLKSDRNYITRFTYTHLGNNTTKLSSDLKVNIMNKACDALTSFFRLKEKGIKCNFPKYIPKDSVYNLIFPHKCNKELVVDNKKKIRLTFGKYVSKNYVEITNNISNVHLTGNVNTDKYINFKKLDFLKEREKKTDKFIVCDNMYTYKNNRHIVDAAYIFINKPKKLCKDNIKVIQIEIVPLYNGYKYKINYTYEETLQIEPKKATKVSECISIDLGLKNLMTIYDPTGEQKIISGGYIHSQNAWFNNKINYYKSIAAKRNKKETTNRIRELFIKRDNIINRYFNLVAKWYALTYNHKKKIIIGYNEGWKTGVNIGRENNRKFYQIPYSRLLKKIKAKMESLGIEVEIVEESYTSKCDSLALEKVGKQLIYSGRRIKRGLFLSATGRLINADINGAINIMRKRVELRRIRGKELYNPKKVNIFSDVNVN